MSDNNGSQKGQRGSSLRALGVGLALGGAVLATAFNTSAHVPSAEKQQEPDLLRPYSSFIANMEKADGGHCCGMQDGIGRVPEKHTDYLAKVDKNGVPHADAQGTHYHVKLTKDHSGKALADGGFWLDIEDKNILDVPQVEKMRAQFGSDSTFKAPPFNIVWASDPTYTTSPSVYCYWPTPKIQ